jgi:type II restriction enzyme
LKQLIGNFKCADVICDFCGFVAQVKAPAVKSAGEKVVTILGGAWKVQEDKIRAGIYHPLYVVKMMQGKPVAIDYIAADFLKPEMFVPRKELSPQARRAGWQGFIYDLRKLDEHVMVEVWSSSRATKNEKGAVDSKLDHF